MKKISFRTLGILTAIVILVGCIGPSIAFAAPRIQTLPPAGENLLVGGDFEDEAKLDSWSFTNAELTAQAAYNSNLGVALHVEPTVSTSCAYVFDHVALAPNSTYTITADVNPNGLSNLDASFEIDDGDAKVTKGQALTGSSWIHNATIATVTTGVEYVHGRLKISMYKGQDGYAYFDNLSMIANGDEWCPTPTGRMTIGEEFHDDFDGNTLDIDRWLISNTAWGGANGGLNSANVYMKTISDKTGNHTCCVLESHGDLYEGNVQGVGENIHRVGSGIVTRDYYASARYEVGCKIEPQLGVCTAFWSFSYVGYQYADASPTGEADEGDGLWKYNLDNNIPENGVRNSEIDWETPSPMDDGGKEDVVSHNNLRTNCWGGKRPGEGGNYSGRSHLDNDATASIADGYWHDLVYEWFSYDNPYTTDVHNDPAVIWFIDGERVDGYDINNEAYIYNDKLWHNELSERPEPMGNFLKTQFQYGIEVPRYGTRFWLACWFPVKDDKLYCVGKSAYTGWAGTPDYDTTHTYLDYCNIIPYTNGGTSYAGETGSVNDATKYDVVPQFLNDPETDLGDEYDVIESVPNKQFALPSEYPNYAINNGLLPAPTPVTVEDGSTVTVSWEPVNGASSYDLYVDGKIIPNATSPYVVTDLDIGNHMFKLRSKSGNVASIWSYEALVPVGTPKNVQVESNGHSLVVTWDEVQGAVDYYMEIDNRPMILNESFISFKNGDTECAYLQGLTAGTDHHIRVKAVGVRGTSNWSGMAIGTIPEGLPDVPSLMMKYDDYDIHKYYAIIDRAYAEKYEIKDMTTGYIYKSYKDGTQDSEIVVDDHGYVTLTFTDAEPGTYYYCARMYKGGAWSDWSTMQYIIIDPNALLQPPGIRADPKDESSIFIYWNDVERATGYDIELNGEKIVSLTEPSYTHTGLSKGTTYKYRVRSKNDDMVSDWSNYAYAIVGESGGGGGGGGHQYSGDGTIINGGFDGNSDPWVTDGDVTYNDGKMTMTAGDISAILSQTVFGMKPNTTYTFTADWTGNTNLAYVYIKNTNGNNNELSTKALPYTFTTGDITSEDGVTFTFSVYKQQVGSLTVDNVSLSEGTVVTTAGSTTTTTKNGGTPSSSTTKTTTTTKATTTTTTTTKKTTTTTKNLDPSSSHTLTIDVKELFPDKWTEADIDVIRWSYSNNEMATFTITLPEAWHPQDLTPEALAACFDLQVNGAPLTVDIDIPETQDKIVGTVNILMNEDKTVTGLISHPNFKHCIIAKETGSDVPETTTTTTTTTTKATTTTTTASSTYLRGDANDDGVVDMKDVLRVRKYVAGQNDQPINLKNADVFEDGNVDMKDVLGVRRIVAGIA